VPAFELSANYRQIGALRLQTVVDGERYAVGDLIRKSQGKNEQKNERIAGQRETDQGLRHARHIIGAYAASSSLPRSAPSSTSLPSV